MSKPTEKHFVTFISPGTFMSKTTTEPIASWDPKLAVAAAERVVERYGAKPYGFLFETRLVVEDLPDGRGGTMRVEPKTVAKSACHFLGGKIETIEEVEARNDPKEEVLRQNMRWNDIALVLVNTNSYRSTLPFEKGHVVVDAAGNITARGDDPKWEAYRAKIAGERQR